MEDNMLQRLIDHLNTEEGKKSVDDYFDRIIQQEKIEDSQIDRFHIKYNTPEKFSYIVEKILKKYRSKEYVNREYGLGRMPNEELLFFLYNYAKKYGREATDEEFETHGNCFTADLYIIHDYCFNIMNGQGTIIKVEKL